MRRTLLIAVLLAMVPSTVTAQDTVELSESQRGYNEKGVAAIREGNYPVAISSFESSLTLGEANVTYLNLGRAYQRAGQCMPAKKAYARVAAAPPVTSPSPDEILAVLEKYSGELPELCPAKIEVVCGRADTRISLDAQEPTPCGGTRTFDVNPGTHTIQAVLNQQIVKKEVTPAEGETVSIVIAFPAEELPAATSERHAEPVSVTTPETSPTSPIRNVGLVVGALGAAGLTAGLIMDVTYVRLAVRPCTGEKRDDEVCTESVRSDAKSARKVNTAVLAVGGGLAVAGAILYFVGGSAESGVSLQYDDGPGIAYFTRF